MTRREEIAWAAGLFEGEGSISRATTKRRRLQLKMVDGAVVRRFAEVVRMGKVYGPYENKMNDGYPRSPFYVWVASSIDDAIDIVAMFWPWLSEHRRSQAVGAYGDAISNHVETDTEGNRGGTK